MERSYKLLKYRVPLILVGLVSIYLVAGAILGSWFIMPSFVALDQAEALTNLRRCADGIERELQHVATVSADWGAWDDTYRFAAEPNDAYREANLVPQTMETSSRINLEFILDTQGQVVAHILYSSKLGGDLQLREFPEKNWPIDHPLLRHAEPNQSINGLMMTRVGPMLVASHPIVNSQEEGPIRGTIIVGRFLDTALLEGLQKDLHLNFTLEKIKDNKLLTREPHLLVNLADQPDGVLVPVDRGHQLGLMMLKDINGQPALLLAADMDRGIVAQGRLALRYAHLSNIGAAVLVLGGIYWLMRRLVLKRIADMGAAVLAIDASGNHSLRVPVEGADELTLLAGQINHMLEQVETSELALRASQQKAEEASRAKSQFLSNVSHEIRTPVNGIMGYSEAIRLSSSLEAARQHAGIILRESGVLLMLVNDLLDLSRLEAGKLGVERTRMDLHQLMEEVGQTISLQAKNKGLDFEVAVTPEVPRWIWGDPLRLRQVVLNLAANAVKFTAQGYVWVVVKSGKDNQGDRLYFVIKDTGIGIPREKFDEIFDPFTQSDISVTRKYGGSGLGLAIVRQLVCLMGGRMQLESQVGKGSVFSFWMPLEPVLEPGFDANAPGGLESDTVEPVTQPARILVVDDYPTNREIVRFFLEEVGHQVVLAENGRQAVQACEEQAFDVILLDVQMPVMDGPEAVHCIRQGTLVNARRPILALTASAGTDTHDLCLQAGFSEVITKPIRRAALLAAIAGWRDREYSGPSESTTEATLAVPGEISTSLPPIDIETALFEFGGAETFNRLLSDFIATATRQVTDLRGAVAQRERTILRSIAHALKGGAGTLEAVPLADAAAALDSAAATAEFDALQQHVEEVAAQLQRLADYVRSSSLGKTEKKHA